MNLGQASNMNSYIRNHCGLHVVTTKCIWSCARHDNIIRALSYNHTHTTMQWCYTLVNESGPWKALYQSITRCQVHVHPCLSLKSAASLRKSPRTLSKPKPNVGLQSANVFAKRIEVVDLQMHRRTIQLRRHLGVRPVPIYKYSQSIAIKFSIYIYILSLLNFAAGKL